MRRRGSDDEDKIKARLEVANKELEQAGLEGFHDKAFVNDDLEVTYKSLESYIFGDDAIYEHPTISVPVDETAEMAITDVETVDGAVATEMEESSKDVVTASTEVITALKMGEGTTGTTEIEMVDAQS